MATKGEGRIDRSAAVKDRIAVSAARLFAERGFASTGVRDIASAAGVDGSIVMRHFGSKEGIFLATMRLPDDWGVALDGPLESLGHRLVEFVVAGSAAEGGAVFAALVRASDRPEVANAVREYTQQIFVDRLVPRMEGPDRELRARLFAAGLTGLQAALWLGGDHVIAHTEVDLLSARYGTFLQNLVTPADT